ncbi:MAG: hypothetical protein C4527_02550 [Candidatus Omnitrophota bacterium]|jgi:sugar lactone lactonase YvrE|nr:MAG: hypothetical protein C4527_02550 [Candidatus Omnitrophota bacterium]
MNKLSQCNVALFLVFLLPLSTSSSIPLISVTLQTVITQNSGGEIIVTLAGTGNNAFSGDGAPAIDAALSFPSGIFADDVGNVYIVDHSNQRIRKVDSLGNINTIAGNGSTGFNKDGIPATTASLNNPNGIWVDESGNIYIADTFNHRVRKIDVSGIITTIAGNGEFGYTGDGLLATEARLNKPFGLFMDNSNNLYIADSGNNVIRRVDSNGRINTIVGIGEAGYSGDGDSATRARLHGPTSVFKDTQGNLYIADTENNVIRKVLPSGTIITIAGNGEAGYSGDNSSALNARLTKPSGIRINGGNLYIADTENNVIRRVDESNKITTVAGDGNSGFSGEGAIAVSASLNRPLDIAFSQDGKLIVSDTRNHRIRILHDPEPVTADAGENQTGPVGVPIQLNGTPGGGDGTYLFNWTILSGPDNNSRQFSSNSIEYPIFYPNLVGTYVLQFTVNDENQEPVSDRLTIVAISVNPLNSVIVTDTIATNFDLSNNRDYDPLDSRELVVQWDFESADIHVADILDIHVYIQIDGQEEPTYLGRTGNPAASYLEWRETNSPLIAPLYRSGPQYGERYQFQVFVLTRSGSPLFYGPLHTLGPVEFLELVDPTATPTNTPTRTHTPEPTNTPTATPSNTLTFTPTPSATPLPTNTTPPSMTPVPTPTNTPAPEPTATHTTVPAQPTATPTNTETTPPTLTPTNTATATSTHTPAATSIPTHTPEPSIPPTAINTPVIPTAISTNTPISTPTSPPTVSVTSTYTPTNSPLSTPTNSPTPPYTATNTPSNTPTNTRTPSATPIPPESVELIINGPTISGNISNIGEEDWYRFSTNATLTHIIETHLGPNDVLTDTTMFLYGPDNHTTLIAFDDDGGVLWLSRIAASLAANHTYYVKVIGYGGFETGPYTIDVTAQIPTPTSTSTPTRTSTYTPTPFTGDPEIRIDPLTLDFIRIGQDEENPPAKQRLEREEPISDWNILLKTGTIETQIQPSNQLDSIAKAVHNSNGKHVLMQFHRLPSPSEQREMERQGIRLLSYVPNMAYWASIKNSRTTLSKLTDNSDIRWMTGAALVDKLSPEAAAGWFPHYALLDDGRVDVCVTFFADVDADEALRAVEAIGGESIGWEHALTLRVAIFPQTLKALSSLDLVEWVEARPAPYQELNAVAAQRIHVAELYSLPHNLNGKNVIVGVWDGGKIDPHSEFGSRMTVINSGASVSSHATHVGGTIGASGAGRSNAKGMAPNVILRSYDWNNDTSEMRAGYAAGIRLSNHSYGLIVGWYWNSAKNAWENWGNSSLFGDYTSTSREWDSVVNDTGLIVFKSAGNDRNDGPGAGQKDGPYDCLPPGGVAKNIITIGATTDNDGMTVFSSWGPTDDGRVKPDLTANGEGLYSTLPGNSYGSYSGTSMSSPSACGAGAMLYQKYAETLNEEPSPTTLKALLIHGAVDKGRPGPDYEYGWGLIDAGKSADLLEGRMWRTGSVTNNTFTPYRVSVNGGPIKVTLVWTDPPGSTSAAKALVNDLDLVLRSPSGTIYRPWILQGLSNPTANATTGVNQVDNVEQVVIDNPQTGLWTIEVRGSVVPQGEANYTVVTELLEDMGTSQSFRIYNDGTAPLNVTSITTDEGDWLYWSPEAPFTILPGENQKVNVSVAYDQSPLGQSSIRLIIESNDPHPEHNPFPHGVFINVNNNATPTPTPSHTPTNTSTPTPSHTPTPTNTTVATATLPPSNTSTPLPPDPPTATPKAASTPGPEATSTPVPLQTATPIPAATSTPAPGSTSTPTPEATSTPVSALSPTPSPTFTRTPTPTTGPSGPLRVLFPFDPLTETLQSLGFTKIPFTTNAGINVIPLNPGNAESTNGIGLKAVLTRGEFTVFNGPALAVTENPVRFRLWFNISDPAVQIALGAYTEIDGLSGAASYTMRGVPEFAVNTWQQTEIEIATGYTRVAPFIVLYNAGTRNDAQVRIDNLEVIMGDMRDAGSRIENLEWHPNFWLDEGNYGSAVIDGVTLVMEKTAEQSLSRFVAYYAQQVFPNRVTVEVDVIRDYGDNGTLTIWVGNGPSAFQKEIPLWMLPSGETKTLTLAGVTTQPSGFMHVVLQISGRDNERIRIPAVRVYEISAN